MNSKNDGHTSESIRAENEPSQAKRKALAGALAVQGIQHGGLYRGLCPPASCCIFVVSAQLERLKDLLFFPFSLAGDGPSMATKTSAPAN